MVMLIGVLFAMGQESSSAKNMLFPPLTYFVDEETLCSAVIDAEPAGSALGEVARMPEHQARRLLYRMRDEQKMRPLSEIIHRSLP